MTQNGQELLLRATSDPDIDVYCIFRINQSQQEYVTDVVMAVGSTGSLMTELECEVPTITLAETSDRLDLTLRVI